MNHIDQNHTVMGFQQNANFSRHAVPFMQQRSHIPTPKEKPSNLNSTINHQETHCRDTNNNGYIKRGIIKNLDKKCTKK